MLLRRQFILDESKNASIETEGGLLKAEICTPYKIYLLIDEYDNFTNELMKAGLEINLIGKFCSDVMAISYAYVLIVWWRWAMSAWWFVNYKITEIRRHHEISL